MGIDGVWTDISDDVLYDEGITIDRGSSYDTPRLDASSGELTLKNPDAKYMRLNPMSSLSGKLHSNQPIRVDRYLVGQDFSVDDASGWSDATECGRSIPWTTSGSGGSVQATDWTVSSGAGRMLIPAANAQRLVYLDDARYRYGEIVVSFTMSQANITGGPVGTALLLRGQNPAISSGYMACEVYINPDESVQIFAGAGGFSTPADFPVTTSIVHTGQKIWIAGGTDGHSIYMKAWTGAITDEPVDWQHVGDGSFYGSGWIGLQARRYTGNTNTNLSVAFDDFHFRSPRIVGVVPSWPPRWDDSGQFEFAPIQIAGIVQRLDNTKAPVESPLRQALPMSEGLVGYWPCEDAAGAQSFASAIPGADPMSFVVDSGAAPPSVASYSGFVASKPLPTVGGSRWRVVVPEHEETGVAHVRFLWKMPSNGLDNLAIICQFYVTGTALRWELKYLTGGSCQLDCYNQSDVNVLAAGPFAFGLDDHKVRFAIQLEQNGSDIDWLVSAPEEGHTGAGFNSGTLAGHTVGRVHDLRFVVGNPAVQYNNAALGHITVSNVSTSLLDMTRPFSGYDGEVAYFRAERICRENDIDFRAVGTNILETAPMGPQEIDTPINILNGIAETTQGAIYETRSVHDGITLVLHEDMRNQDKQMTLSLENKQLVGSFQPDDDPQRRYNDLTVRRRNGSSVHVEQNSGEFAISRVGRRPAGDVEVNPQFDQYLNDIANFMLQKFTVNDYLFKSFESQLELSGMQTDHDMCRKMLDLELYERTILTGLSSRKLFNEVELLPRGYKERLDQFTHSFSWNAQPGNPYITFTLDNAMYGTLGTQGYSLLSTIDDNDTALGLERAVGEPLWSTTAPPQYLELGGEVMEITSVDQPTTPSFIAVGTVAHANNANVSPGVPGGTTTTDDTLVLVLAVRNSAIVSSVNNGYVLVGNANNIRIYTKTHSGSESAPTVTISGGAAGDDVTAQICSIRNAGPNPVFADAVSNGSQQNINFPGASLPLAAWFAICIGWKQDDWTSVATPTYHTEIAEPDTTTGNDQGMVWSYRLGTDTVDVGASQYVVTGGASAIGVGVVMVWGNRQVINVNRSVNDVVKAHNAGTPIRVWPTKFLGLGYEV